MFGGRMGNALKKSNPAAYYSKYVAPQLDRPGMAGAAANVERQRLLKSVTGQDSNPGLDIRSGPGRAVVSMSSGGVPIYGEVSAPASAPAPAPAPSGPSPQQQQAVAQLTKESEAYRTKAEEELAAAKLKISELEDPTKQMALAKELQDRLRIISSANLARSQMAPKLQIAPATSMPLIGGTAQFKRRQQSMVNSPVSNTLNV